MEFKKLAAPSLKELFITEIQNMILSGKLEIGEQLPPERELAESMHVSRAVVNSGITTLEKKGFLDVRPRVGNFVADYRRNGTLETLVTIMNYNGGMLRDNEVKSILEVRVIILSLAAKLTIEQASDEAIQSLTPFLEQLKSCEDPEETANLMFPPIYFSPFSCALDAGMASVTIVTRRNRIFFILSVFGLFSV